MATDSAGSSGIPGPASVELLWGDTQRPSRGPKPKLTARQIAETAIAVADAEGLDAVSMQRVAGELGFTTMSLYRYMPGKDQLLELMLDIAAGHPPAAPGGASWRAEIEHWVREMWSLYQRHPWALRVELSGPPVGPGQLAWFEAALRPLARAGLDAADMVAAVTYLTGSVRELARMSAQFAHARGAAGVSAGEAEADFARALREYVDAERFPTLAGLVAADVFEPAEGDGDVVMELDFGIQRLLDGIAAYARGPGCELTTGE